MPLAELLDERTESVPGVLRIEFLQVRDDVIDPMEQLKVVEIREILFAQIVQEAPTLADPKASRDAVLRERAATDPARSTRRARAS